MTTDRYVHAGQRFRPVSLGILPARAKCFRQQFHASRSGYLLVDDGKSRVSEIDHHGRRGIIIIAVPDEGFILIEELVEGSSSSRCQTTIEFTCSRASRHRPNWYSE